MVEAEASGLADGVVDDLDEDVPRGAGDDQARTLGGAGDLLADADVATQRATAVACQPCACAATVRWPCHLPAFPTLRRMCSPA